MSSLKAAFSFPSPYGVEVPVYRQDPIDPSDPDAFCFGMEATAICAGIHDKAERARFAADAGVLGRLPPLQKYGGRELLHVPIQRPSETAVYHSVVASSANTPIEAWITGAMDRPRWCDRAAFLIEIIGENMETAGPERDPMEGVYAFGVALLLTGTLEHLGEKEIDCIEAAAFYALAAHDEYAKAGRDWLFPVRKTWFRDWAAARPRYRRLIRALRGPMDLPGWLGEIGGAKS